MTTDYNSNIFILAWDMYGLESCINASELDREKTFAVLADKPARSQNLGSILQSLTLRARFNVHRRYEIYSIAVDPSITREELVRQFDENPQDMADLIRTRGNKIYSDRIIDPDARIKIT